MCLRLCGMCLRLRLRRRGKSRLHEVHQTILAQETMLTIYNDGEDHGLHSSNITLAFTAENVDQEYERLLEKGVEICEKPVSRPWGARNMSFYDPDGNLVYIRSFPK